jgi:signal transduction histidine kinase
MLRHAHATQMEVKLRYEPAEVILEIRDNGLGFQVGQQSEGFGIRGMQRRCSRIGGQMEILSTPGEGTRIIVSRSKAARPHGRSRVSISSSTAMGESCRSCGLETERKATIS